MRIVLFFTLFFVVGFSQTNDSISRAERTIAIDDPYYREDQFYFAATHSLMVNESDEFQQNSISLGLNAGFLRDIPLTKDRNFSIAPGIGLAYLNLHNNLVVPQGNASIYFVDSKFSGKIQNLYFLELPVEFRWRNSTMESHKFWRVYLGFKYSYLFKDTAVFPENNQSVRVKSNKNLSSSMFGVYLSTGFNTWNIYAYYGFTPFLKQNINLSNRFNFLNIGLIFYIL